MRNYNLMAELKRHGLNPDILLDGDSLAGFLTALEDAYHYYQSRLPREEGAIVIYRNVLSAIKGALVFDKELSASYVQGLLAEQGEQDLAGIVGELLTERGVVTRRLDDGKDAHALPAICDIGELFIAAQSLQQQCFHVPLGGEPSPPEIAIQHYCDLLAQKTQCYPNKMIWDKLIDQLILASYGEVLLAHDSDNRVADARIYKVMGRDNALHQSRFARHVSI